LPVDHLSAPSLTSLSSLSAARVVGAGGSVSTVDPGAELAGWAGGRAAHVPSTVVTSIEHGRALSGETWLRPQALAFALLAEHVLGRGIAVFSGSFIEVFDRLGIGEHAARATLARMTNRGLLVRHRRGRRVYFGLTPRCERILEDGRLRIWVTGAVNDDTDGRWTLLSFSMPETWQRQRHDLRSRLTWSGFGPLQSGLWIAPGRVDVAAIVAELGLDAHVRVFHATPAAPTDLIQVVSGVFDLGALAAGYERFLATWDRSGADRNAGDALALTLRLSTEWLQVIRRDPRLPLHLLPDGWPAVRAQEVFVSLHSANDDDANRIAAELFDAIAT
jgi:phenylacetic acid degradation operon negative regulatory protein